MRSTDRDELLRALDAGVRTLIAEAQAKADRADDVCRMAARLEPQLPELLESTLHG